MNNKVFPSLLFIMPLLLSKCSLSHKCLLLIGQRGRVKHRDRALLSFVFYYLPVPVRAQTIVDLCQQWEQCCCCCCYFSMLLRAVVRNTITYSERLPDMSFWSPTCCVGVACHRPLVPPQWLAIMSRKLQTDHCWLTNQQLSTTNLCRGPSRLTAFCVAVIELNRW